MEARLNISSDSSCFVTINTVSLYSNIDHYEGAEVCFKFIRSNDYSSASSTYLSKPILLVLVALFIMFISTDKGYCYGTLMAFKFANLFISDTEKKMLDDF